MSQDLTYALDSVNISLDQSSARVLYDYIVSEGVDVVKLDNKYYFKEKQILIEFDCIVKEISRYNNFPAKIIKILNMITMLQRIEGQKEITKFPVLGNGGQRYHPPIEIDNSLAVKYLLEKVKSLEERLKLSNFG